MLSQQLLDYLCSFLLLSMCFFFFSSRRRHTRFKCDWSSDVCSSDLVLHANREVASTDSGEAGTGAGAVAGSTRGGVAGFVARKIDAGNEISAERWEPVWRGGCGGGGGAGGLGVAPAGMDFEDSRAGGNSPPMLSVACRAPELAR